MVLLAIFTDAAAAVIDRWWATTFPVADN